MMAEDKAKAPLRVFRSGVLKRDLPEVQLQVGMPRGSGSEHVFVVPSCVMTIFAVADPSYVITSRRSFVVGDWPAMVIVACIERITVPAVGYVGLPETIGTTSPLVVSPTSRVDVNAPSPFLPVVDSSPRDTPLTVRCVLPTASPVMVRSLELLTVDTALSWRVRVPVAWIFAFTTFVVLSGFDWTVPSAFVYEVLLTIVRPCSFSEQVTRPVVLEKAQSPSSGP
jgi:hypothetical protein